MSRWFRVYDDLIDDPKVQRLPAELFRALINLWCLASKGNGELPPIADVAYKLRVSPARASKILSELGAVGLLDAGENGPKPHNWHGRQYKSDVSTERVQRFRKRFKTVSETPPDTETETEQKEGADAPKVRFQGKVIRLTEEDFDAWAKANPHVELESYLLARDAFLWEQPAIERRRWYISTSADLRNKNLQEKRAKTPARNGNGMSGRLPVFKPEAPRPALTPEEIAERVAKAEKVKRLLRATEAKLSMRKGVNA